MNSGFDKIAPFYDLLARLIFGKAIRQSQLVFLNKLQECRAVLVIGGGTGWWLNDLFSINPNINVTFVDASSNMIERAQRKISQVHSVKFIPGTFESVSLDQKFDGVILYYFLDMYRDTMLSGLLKRITENLTPGAVWIVTDFVEEKKWHSHLLKIMYNFFGYMTNLKTRSLPDWKKAMRDSNLKMVDQKKFYGDFMCSSVWK